MDWAYFVIGFPLGHKPLMKMKSQLKDGHASPSFFLKMC